MMRDYELALQEAFRDEFARENPESIGGCAFHWKQTNRRKLLELQIPKDLITNLIGSDGLINFLVILKYDEIPKGIAYIRYHMREGSFKKSFDKYWNYFQKTWMKKTLHYNDKTGRYLFSSWNISHLIDAHGRLAENENGHDVCVNRTNNPLERFNRKLNERVPTHPTVQVFVERIKEVCNEYVDIMNIIKLGKGKKQNHAPVELPKVPVDFASFHF